MTNSEITDPLFRQAVEAIDAGDEATLRALVDAHPRLVRDRLVSAEEGYFEKPYLIWFVADNPIRHEKLPDNIVEVTGLLIGYVRQLAPETYDHQINYTLGLVATGRIPRECGVQIALIDLLLESGAVAGGVEGVIGHGNLEAAAHIILRGGELSLAASVGFGRKEDMERLLASASLDDKNLALIVAAFFGRTDLLARLVAKGARPNEMPVNGHGFHSHASALHQAVYSGSVEAVKFLVEAGADLRAVDKAYDGTPLDWANYMQREEGVEVEMRGKYKIIEEYIKGL